MDLKCPENAEGLEELEKMVPLCRKEVFRQVKAKVETQGISEREASRQVAEELEKPEASIRQAVRREKLKPKMDIVYPPILTESDQRFILKEAKGMKHYYLNQWDTIEAGDEQWTAWGTWEPIKPEWVGSRKGSIMGWRYKVRREVKEAGDDCSKDA